MELVQIYFKKLKKLAVISNFLAFFQFLAVFRIRISFHPDLDLDPDPGSLNCPYGSGSRPLIFYSDPDRKGVKI